MKKVSEFIIKFILSYITTLSVAGISGFSITGIEIILPCVFVLAFIIYSRGYDIIVKQAERKRIIGCSMPVGILFSAGLTVGSHFEIWDGVISDFGPKDIMYFFILSLFFSTVVINLFSLIDELLNKSNQAEKKTAKIANGQIIRSRWFVYGALVMFICWLPYYLVLFPGNIGSDTFEEIQMCLGMIPWTNHHPIFYTMLIGLVIKAVPNLTAAMAVCSILQMLILAGVLSYVAMWIYVKRNNVTLSIISVIFFALHPMLAMYSMYLTKDVLFSCALVMLTLKIYDILDVDNRKDYCLIVVYALLTMLLRNNGLMIVLVAAIVLLIANRSSCKKIIVSMGAPVVIYLLFKTCAYNILDVSPQSFAEAASIPLQQTGYVICNSDESLADELTGNEYELLQEIMPFDRVKEVYTLGYTDPIKFDEAFDDKYFNEHKSEYMGIWFKLLKTHFGDYVKAYLAQTAGYWHYGESNTVCTEGVAKNSLAIAGIDLIDKMTGLSLKGLISKLMLVARKAPLLCILSSMAMQFYMLILVICNYIRKKEGKSITALVPLVTLWITIMIASPAFCLFRYTFALFIMWPVLIEEMIKKDR